MDQPPGESPPCGIIPLEDHSPGETFPGGIMSLGSHSPADPLGESYLWGIIPLGNPPWRIIPLGNHLPGGSSPWGIVPLGNRRPGESPDWASRQIGHLARLGISPERLRHAISSLKDSSQIGQRLARLGPPDWRPAGARLGGPPERESPPD